MRSPSSSVEYSSLGGIAAGISNQIGNMTSMLSRAISHGIVSGVRAVVQGGNFLLGFMSSFASTYLQPIGRALAKGSYYGRAFFSAMVGGTVSMIGGGKFANGAVTSAFQFMFNESLHPDPLTGMPAEIANKIKISMYNTLLKLKRSLDPNEWKWFKIVMSDIRASNAQMVRLGRGTVSVLKKFGNGTVRAVSNAHPAAQAVFATATGIALTPTGRRLYEMAMMHPEAIIGGAEVVNDFVNPSLPATTPYGQAKTIIQGTKEWIDGR